MNCSHFEIHEASLRLISSSETITMSAPSSDDHKERRQVNPARLGAGCAIVTAVLVFAAALAAGVSNAVAAVFFIAGLVGFFGFGVFGLVSAVKPARWPQFSLWNILVWMTVMSVLLGAYAAWGPDGLIVSLIGALVIGAVYGAGKHPVGARQFLPLAALGGISVICLYGLLLPTISISRVDGRRSSCSANLKQIGFALQEYHDTYGSLPPAYIVDKEGKPMHSWRVLILPFLEQTALYQDYDFSEPWNGPHNSKLALQPPPDCYSCPESSASSKSVNYVVVVGAGTAWPGAKGTSFDDFSDGASDTALLVEVANSGVNWMEPKDFDVGQVSLGINSKTGNGISSGHKNGVNALYADGSVGFIPNTVSAKELQAMLTIAGGEKVVKP